MAGHRDSRSEGDQQGARSKEGQGVAKPWYETPGKVLTGVQGFSAAGDVAAAPPSPAQLRGDTKPVGTGIIPKSAKNDEVAGRKALGAFGLGGKRNKD